VASLSPLLSLAHLVGLSLSIGAATVKLALLLRCRDDQTFIPVFVRVARPVTRLIILGLILLTVSGVVWLVRGYPWTPLLVVKLVLVAAVWVIGPVIDNVVEPRIQKLAPGPGDQLLPAFRDVLKQYLQLEVVATLLFYVVTVVWVWR